VQANLPDAVKYGDNPESRSGMSYAAMLSGITLANAGLGLIHGFASSIGGYHKIPHGVVCGTLMGIVNRYNVTALINQHEVTPAHEKYGKLGKLFSGRNNKSLSWYMEYAADYIEVLSEQLKMKHLGDFGITAQDLNHIAGNADHKANPVKFEKDQLVEMLEKRL
jgi:alcohol dehydrogenase class IV